MLGFNINISSNVLLRIKMNVRFQYKADIHNKQRSELQWILL